MAKKTVATLQKKGAKTMVKLVKAVRSEKTGAYTFREEMVSAELAREKANE